MALTLISATSALDNNGISYGEIVWLDDAGNFHAKVSRPPFREDTAGYPTAQDAKDAAKVLATSAP